LRLKKPAPVAVSIEANEVVFSALDSLRPQPLKTLCPLKTLYPLKTSYPLKAFYPLRALYPLKASITILGVSICGRT